MYSLGLSLGSLILLITSGVNGWHIGDVYRHGMSHSQVLGGNYGPNGLSGLPDLRAMRRNTGGPVGSAEQDESETTGGKPRAATTADVQKGYAENFKAVIMKAINITKRDESTEFLSVVQKCDDQIEKPCLILDPELCRKMYIRCLVQDNKLLDSLTKVIGESLGLLCKPLRTKYTNMFKKSAGGFPHLKTYADFLKYLNVQPKDFPVTASQLGNAMIPAIIQNVLTPLLPLKAVLQWMDNEMTLQQSYAEGFDTNNPGCLTLHMAQSIEVLIDLFFKDVALTDVLLPGFVYFNAGSKYTSGNTFGMALLTETLRMFTGTGSGFACNAEDPFDAHHDDTGSTYRDFTSRGSNSKSGNSRMYPHINRKKRAANTDKGNCDEFGKNMQTGFPVSLTLKNLDTRSLTNLNCNNNKLPNTDKGGKDKANPDEASKEVETKDEAATEEGSTDEPPTDESKPIIQDSVTEEPEGTDEAVTEEGAAKEEEEPKEEGAPEEGAKEEGAAADPAAETPEESAARKRRKSGPGQVPKKI